MANFLCERRPYRDSRLCLTQDVRGAYVPSLFSRQCFLRNGAVRRAVLAVVPNTGCQRCLGALFVLEASFLRNSAVQDAPRQVFLTKQAMKEIVMALMSVT